MGRADGPLRGRRIWSLSSYVALGTTQFSFLKGLAKSRAQHGAGPFPLSLKCFAQEAFYYNTHSLWPKEGCSGDLGGMAGN